MAGSRLPLPPPQHVTRKNTLDLFLQKKFPIQRCVITLHDLSSDHEPIWGRFRTDLVIKHHNNTPLINWKKITNTLDNKAIQYHNLRDTSAFDSIIEQLETNFKNAAKEGHKSKFLEIPPSIPPDIKKLIKRRNQAHGRWQKFRQRSDKNIVNNLSKTIKRKLKDFNSANWKECEESLKPEDNSLWQAVKRRISGRDRIPPIKGPVSTAYSDQDKANSFAQHLEKQFTPNDTSDPNFENHIHNTVRDYITQQNPAHTLEVRPSEVRKIIKDLKKRKAPGEDGISNQMLKLCPTRTILQISMLIYGCLKLCYFPDKRKMATVITIPKQGKDNSTPEGYRPISLLSALSKILEKLIYRDIMDYCNQANILIDHQFGFRAKHSTSHQLFRVCDFIAAGLNNGERSISFFADIKSAFNVCWLEGITYKLIICNFHLT